MLTDTGWLPRQVELPPVEFAPCGFMSASSEDRSSAHGAATFGAARVSSRLLINALGGQAQQQTAIHFSD